MRSSTFWRKSATPLRSTVEWKGTSMPGTYMNGRFPPASRARRFASSSSALRPATVPATAYCWPARLKLTICRNSPEAPATDAT